MSSLMQISTFAGLLPEESDLINVPQLLKAYENDQPDPTIASQRVTFGTSGHRGSSLDRAFNRNHILAITQSICNYRKKVGTTGPLFLGFDTHALSLPAFRTALEVLSANDVTVMISKNQEFTPTPVISHAILSYNRGRTGGLADGIVVTPSHNPPREGGFKYNPTHGGPAEKSITDWIQNQANDFLSETISGEISSIRRKTFEESLRASTTHIHDFLNPYIRDLDSVIDMNIIRDSKIKIGVDPMGGAGIFYWEPIANHYKIDLTVLNKKVDPCFRFMTRDWDGQIRMDPSSRYAMKSLIEKSSAYDIAFGCDTDHDRHGIVCKKTGLLPPNHFMSAAVFYLFQNRPQWSPTLQIGKTLVSSQMIDRVAKLLDRSVYEVPVGFKWFVDGLINARLGFAGEESAGATFLRKDGSVWTTDKDAFVPALLSAEMTAQQGKDPHTLYQELTQRLGNPVYRRVEAPATVSQRKKLATTSISDVKVKKIANSQITQILTNAAGNEAPIGGIKIEIEEGWLAARPSGTEDIYKIYGESFRDLSHLEAIIREGEAIVQEILDRP